MPFIHSTYRPPFLLSNNHLQTIIPALFRKVDFEYTSRERIEFPDGDFVDIDWSKKGAKKLVLVTHGLEGSADRHYIKGVLKEAQQRGWDGAGFNLRSCSGEMNRLMKTYHSGATQDLKWVIEHIIEQYNYESIALVGFSLGGNLTLKYLGEESKKLPAIIKKGVGVSVPCDLVGSAKRIGKWDNRIYIKRFLSTLIPKVEEKEQQFPDAMDYSPAKTARNFFEFDGGFTAPANGYSSALDYYTRASSLPDFPKINIPFLLLNAKDDSFLGEKCYPKELAQKSDLFHLETPDHGGHVGFLTLGEKGRYWSDIRIMDFIQA